MGEKKSPDQIRAFIAAEIGAEVRERLTGLLARLKEAAPGVSWSRAGSLHLTLRFLGNISPEQVDAAGAALAEAARSSAPVEVEVAGWGTFPPGRRPRVIWAGLARGGEELKEIFNCLEQNLARRGLGPADKPFSPHLTLGRVKSGDGLVRAMKILESAGRGSWGVFTVEQLVLFQSELNPGGAVYTKLREERLRGGVGG